MEIKSKSETEEVRGKRGKGKGAGDRSTTTATAETTAGNLGTGSGTGSGTDKAEKAEKKPVEVAVLVPETEEKKTKKKRTPKKKEPEKKVKSDDISKLLVTVSAIVASRPDQSHWMITQEEADSIAAPLSNILEKSEVFSKIAEHSDSLALATACITVFAPRAVMSVTAYKQKEKVKKVAKSQHKRITESGNERGKSRNNSAQPDRGSIKDASIGENSDLFIFAQNESIV